MTGEAFIFRYQYKPHACCEFMSPTVEDVVGYPPERFYEDSDFDLRIVHRPDRLMAQELVEDPSRCGVLRLEHRLGRTVCIALTKYPRFGVRNEVVGIEALVRRITEEQAHLYASLRTASVHTWTAYPLSPRELEVLGLVAGGDTDAEIAVKLGLSRRTVERHMAHTLMKFGVRTRAAAVAAGYASIFFDRGAQRILGKGRAELGPALRANHDDSVRRTTRGRTP